MTKRITMKDLAERAGVSQATVSHALRGTGKISAATRQRIQELAAEMGFREDPLMSALASYRSMKKPHGQHRETIAVVVTEDPDYHWRRANDGVRLMEGIHAGAERWGFKVDLFEHDASERRSAILSRILRNRGIRGVILTIPRPWERERPRQLQWNQFTTVACRPLFQQEGHHCVTSNFFLNGRLLYRKLSSLGYKRVGIYLSHKIDSMTHRGFTAGMLTEERLHGSREEPIPPLIVNEWNIDEFSAWHDRWVPDAVVTQRWSVRIWLKQFGRRNPAHVGLAVPITAPDQFDAGIYLNEQRMGMEAVELLREQLILGNFGLPELPIQINVPGVWHPGGSVRQLLEC